MSMTQEYCLINVATSICDNTVMWDGNTSTWTPPAGYLILVQATTPAFVWQLNSDKTAYVLTESNGAGQIGFTWNGAALITNEPQPEPPKPQPVVSGAQNL